MGGLLWGSGASTWASGHRGALLGIRERRTRRLGLWYFFLEAQERQMSICLRRREFIAGLGGAAVSPLVVRAQQRALPVIGYLSGRTADFDALPLVSFRRGLADVGYAEGRNVAVEYRFADGRYDRIPAMAADLVSRRVAVIVASGTTAQGGDRDDPDRFPRRP